MAKAPAKTAGKKKTFKKKEKKIVPVGMVHVQASFNNTIITITDPMGNVIVVVEFGFAGVPRIAQGHAVRRAAGFADGGQQGQGIGLADGGSAGQRSGRRAANRRCARCRRRAWKCGASRIARRSRITDAVRRRSAEFDRSVDGKHVARGFSAREWQLNLIVSRTNGDRP